jgi:hypothetical protein
MQRIGTRRRWLGAVLTTLALGALAAPAGALELDNTTDTSITIDSNVHWFNDVRPMTDGNYQILVYWDSEGFLWDDAPLKVTRRRLSDDRLESTSFDGTYELTDVADGHNTVRAGISRNDGRIHISWTIHNDPHQYVVSSAGCISQARFSDCTWSRRSQQADVSETRRVTYPIYFNAPDGTLYMTYREGSSERGDQYLNRYNDDGTWTHVGMVMQGRSGGSYDPDGGGAIPNSTDRGPYIWGFKFDKNSRIHVMWNWREDGAFSGGAAQHDGYYAYSDDRGSTWFNSAGTRVATAGSDPLKVTDSGLEVIDLPYNSHLLALELELDSHNQPHAVFPVSDVVTEDFLVANIRQMHAWRTTSGSWYADWIEPSNNTQVYEFGDLMFDRADNAYYVYNDNLIGWYPVNVDPFVQTELRWDMMTVQSGALNIQQMTTATEILTDSHVDTPISTSGNKQIRVRMRNNTEGVDPYFWWTTDASQTWAGARSQAFTRAITRDDRTGWRDYTFTITDADWTGNLRELLFSPIGYGTTAEAGDEIDIDYIRITDAAGNIAKQWEFSSGATVVAAEASPTDNWASWNIDTLLPGVNDVWSDASFGLDPQRYADGTGDGKKVNFTVLEQGAPWFESLTLREFDISGDTVSKGWNFDVDTQGWTATNHVSGFGWESDGGAKSVAGTITGNDSQLKSPDNLKVKVDGDFIHVRLKNTSASTTAHVYFITDADATWNETKSKTFTTTANSDYTEYSIDMSRVSGWSGQTLRQLRLDPSDDATTRGSFKVARVYIDRT